MPLSKSHKEATRRKIIIAAGRLFRLKGYEGIGIAGIMAEVGLTRGGFYAHFWSKAALFRETLRSGDGLLARLRARAGEQSRADILADYLDPQQLKQVHETCTLATLTGDVAKSDALTRQAYTNVFKKLVSELGGEPGSAEQQKAMQTAVLALGGVMLAGALSDEKLAAQVLASCKAGLGKFT